jgi:hypothetical protein
VGQLKRSGLAMYQSKGWRGWFCTPRIPRHRPWAPVDFRVRSIGEHGPASFASGAFTLVDEVDYVVREFHGAGARRPVKVEPMNLAFRLHKLHFTASLAMVKHCRVPAPTFPQQVLRGYGHQRAPRQRRRNQVVRRVEAWVIVAGRTSRQERPELACPPVQA